jgi:hypothetical protein
MSVESGQFLQPASQEPPVIPHPIESMDLNRSVVDVIVILVVTTFAVLASGLALARFPTSLAILGIFLLTVLAVAGLVRLWCRNSGSIVFTDEELIITPRSGPTSRRTLDRIESIERHYARRFSGIPRVDMENYVRIFSDGEVPLQFLWDVGLNIKGASDADRFVANLQTRLPGVPVHIVKGQRPEKITVEHARRNAVQSHAGEALLAVVLCGVAGVLINTIVPKSSGSATAALQRFERSVGDAQRTSLPGDDSTSARSISCFGQTGDSYWEEDFFNLQIRKVEIRLATMSDPKTAETRARKILPKSWKVYGTDYLPDAVGKATLSIETPCFTAKKGQFYPSLEARFTSAIEKLRTKVDGT